MAVWGELRPSLSGALTKKKAPSSSTDLVRKASISSHRNGADLKEGLRPAQRRPFLTGGSLPSEKTHPAGNAASLPEITEESSNGSFTGEEVLGLLLGPGSLVP